ncbi:RNA polymerase sigma factor [Nocardiopsis lambiniae]|uniref:Sigma-70 family RNA polymerase sigma factor n=1 Tax=Nocardiopsis lambiniae TaxID=3075539 RepID=A0ABU2M3F7_9ACTN|nr:sigma-70 family RNA polymerase sigma factor [Nocardiopsis sp. DSM 44743]MDT0327167.1 sigma-70 family RNA polymerase sigma factor [Nocardiopsis sp. DSM 44743]
MTDRELLHTLRADGPPSAEAYERLLDAYGEELFRRCILALGDRDAAHVVLRDTLIVACAHIGRLTDADRLGEWLHALTEVECVRRMSYGHRLPGEWVLPENTVLVRIRVLKGMATPELDGYRAHVAARADRFDREGFPLGPGAVPVSHGPALVGSFGLMVLVFLVAAVCAGYLLTRTPEAEGPPGDPVALFAR